MSIRMTIYFSTFIILSAVNSLHGQFIVGQIWLWIAASIFIRNLIKEIKENNESKK